MYKNDLPLNNLKCHKTNQKQTSPFHLFINAYEQILLSSKGRLLGVMGNGMNYIIEENDLELHSCYHVHIRTNNLEKSINSLISPPTIR